jgi:hypothetical protein
LQEIALALAPPEERAPGWAQRFPKEIPTVHQFHRAFDLQGDLGVLKHQHKCCNVRLAGQIQTNPAGLTYKGFNV